MTAAAREGELHTRYLDSIKSFEGFNQEARWDYAQHSNGFGTKAHYPGERISRAEAEQRFAAEIELARNFVKKHASGWDEGTKAALTSLTFNAGTRWAWSGLGEAVRDFDIDAVRSRFLEYTKAGGKDLPGLVNRRLAEVSWIGESSAEVPSATARTGADVSDAAKIASSAAPVAMAGRMADQIGSLLRQASTNFDCASSPLGISAMLLLVLDQELSKTDAELRRGRADAKAVEI